MKIVLLCLMMAGCAMALPLAEDSTNSTGYNEGNVPAPDEGGEIEEGEVMSDFFIKEMTELLANKNSTHEEERQKRFLINYSELKLNSLGRYTDLSVSLYSFQVMVIVL